MAKPKRVKLNMGGPKGGRSMKDTTPDRTESKARKLMEKRMGMKS